MTQPAVLLLNPPGDKLSIRDYYCRFSSKTSYYWPPQDLLALSGILDGAFEVRSPRDAASLVSNALALLRK